ncbi:MAG: DUF2059 domain-containing protein [Alphaproteobacteria bacterium]|nr:DUF2059 domain-containing protein [Alphaproteobacteria bacterium]
MKKLALVLLLSCLTLPVAAQEKPAEPALAETPAGSPDMDQRVALAEKMHDIWPVRPKVEEALDVAAQSFPEEERAAFKAGMRKAIKYDQLEEESIAAMAKIFTVPELQKMVDFYGSPEGRAVSAKTGDYAEMLQPVMTKMLDQALIQVRTGR